jgi:hypothetical protein
MSDPVTTRTLRSAVPHDPKAVYPPCEYRGDATGTTCECSTCGGGKQMKLFHCSVHGKCTIDRKCKEGDVPCCRTCKERKAPEGVTSIRPETSKASMGETLLTNALNEYKKAEDAVKASLAARDNAANKYNQLRSSMLGEFDKRFPLLLMGGQKDAHSV